MKDIKLEKADRIKRIIARGEHSNHSHVLFGDIKFLEDCFNVESSPDYDKAEIRYKEYSVDLLSLKIKFGFNPENPDLFDKKNPEFLKEKLPLQGKYN